MDRELPKTVKIDRRRYRRTTRFFAGIILHVFVRDIMLGRIPFVKRRVERSRPRRYRNMARDFRRLAVNMGGVMIKLGQFFSTRVDVLPPEIIQELRGLQDEVPAVPSDQIITVLQEELGNLDVLFSHIDYTPLAAASLGQTHKAILKSQNKAWENGTKTPLLEHNESVVIKVQRPGIVGTVLTDLSALRKVAKWVQRYKPISRHANIPSLMEEFAKTLWEELDYELEAENAARFGTIFADYDGIVTPHVHTEHSTKNVLVMEDVSGMKIDDLDGIANEGIDPHAVADRLLDVYFQQVVVESFFHADPHPGNLFLRPRPDKPHTEGESTPFDLIFIDFGMMGRIPSRMNDELRSILMCIVTRDARGFIEAFDKLGFFLPGADLNRLAAAQDEVLDLVWGRDLLTMNNPDPEEAMMLMQQFKDILFDFPFQVPQNFIYLGRATGILSGMSAMLNPAINPWGYIEKYGQRLVSQQNETPTDIMALVQEYAILPAQMKRVLSDLEFGRLRATFTPDSITEYRLKRLEKRTRQANTTVVCAAGLISGTLLYLNEEPQAGIIAWSLSGLLYLWSQLRRR